MSINWCLLFLLLIGVYCKFITFNTAIIIFIVFQLFLIFISVFILKESIKTLETLIKKYEFNKKEGIIK